jgi:hypothetical protein
VAEAACNVLTRASKLVTIRALINGTTDFLDPEMNLLNHQPSETRALAPTFGRAPCVLADAQDRFVSGRMVTG